MGGARRNAWLEAQFVSASHGQRRPPCCGAAAESL